MCVCVCVLVCCVCVCACVCVCVLVCVPADNIETQVETASVRVEGGNKQLEKAVRHKVYIHTRVPLFVMSSKPDTTGAD